MSCRIHVPSDVWRGNEVEKRSALFRLALEGATPERDWFLILDGDQIVERMDADAMRRELVASTHDVASVYTRVQADPLDLVRHRSFFRAIPGFTVEGAHYNYVASRRGRKVYLWHPSNAALRVGAEAVPDHDLTQHMVIRHRAEPRPPGRMNARARYYKIRDGSRIEFDS